MESGRVLVPAGGAPSEQVLTFPLSSSWRGGQGVRWMKANVMLQFVSIVIPAALHAQSPSTILGTWQGTSICVKASWNAACNDERIVYEVTPAASKPGQVTLRASKIVGDSLDWMGDLDLAFDTLSGRWSGDFQNTRVHIRWSYRAVGDSLTGNVVMIPSGQVGRNVVAVRSKPPGQ